MTSEAQITRLLLFLLFLYATSSYFGDFGSPDYETSAIFIVLERRRLLFYCSYVRRHRALVTSEAQITRLLLFLLFLNDDVCFFIVLKRDVIAFW